MRGFRIIIAIALAMGSTSLASQAWQPPADHRLSDEQVEQYLLALNDWAGIYGKLLDRIASASSEADRIAAASALSEAHDDWLKKHGMSEEQYQWLGQQVSAAWAVASVQDSLARSNSDADEKIAEDRRSLSEAQKRLEAYQAAKKNGVRVLSMDQRNAAVDAAKDDQQAASDEIKQYQQDSKAAEADLRRQNATAAAAEAAAANPPSDISADDRQRFIDGKKSDAQDARNAARDSQAQLEDLKNKIAEAQARMDLAARRIAHPDVPLTEDEKASVGADDDSGIATAQSDIRQYEQEIAGLAMMQSEMKKSMARMDKDVPPQNVELIKKYSQRYEDALKRLSNPTSRPSS